MSVSPLKIVEEAYREYSQFVNSYRSLPSSIDGLKSVQRRVILTLLEQGQDLYASASVVGDCMKKFHPHGDSSIYGTIVNLVNQIPTLLKKKGNFGNSGLYPTGAAAYRYTKVGLSKFCVDNYTPLVKFANASKNENDYKEFNYLPTAIPYCLFTGSIGLGVGCATNIPPIELDDLKSSVKAILQGREPPLLRPYDPKGGIIEIDEENIKKLNTEGTCQAVCKCPITLSEIDKRKVVIVDGLSQYVPIKKLFDEFANEIAQRIIFVRDESYKGETRIVIGRDFRVKRVSEKEILDRTRKALTKKIVFSCMVSHKGKACMMTPNQMIRYSLKYVIEAYSKYIDSKVKDLEKSLIFEIIKPHLPHLLLNNKELKAITIALKPICGGITDHLVLEFLQKPLTSLRTGKKDIAHLKKMRLEWEDKFKDLNKSFLSEIFKFKS